MFFRLCNASATFERLVEKMLHKVCLVYLDDVIIFSKDFEDVERLRQVFLRTSNLKLNLTS